MIQTEGGESLPKKSKRQNERLGSTFFRTKESDKEGDREGKLWDVWRVVKSQEAHSETIGEEE